METNIEDDLRETSCGDGLDSLGLDSTMIICRISTKRDSLSRWLTVNLSEYGRGIACTLAMPPLCWTLPSVCNIFEYSLRNLHKMWFGCTPLQVTYCLDTGTSFLIIQQAGIELFVLTCPTEIFCSNLSLLPSSPNVARR